VLGLLDELGLQAPVLAGYDIGSRIAQAVARAAPDRARALVLSPPLPGAGQRVLTADAQREFWYQPFHSLGLVEELVDGRPAAAAPICGISGRTGRGRPSSRMPGAWTTSSRPTGRPAP
jgi:pimeloyl-ACP methyl ester carboxylesterase